MSDFDQDGLTASPPARPRPPRRWPSLKAPAEQAARAIDEAFAKAGSGLAKSLAHAAPMARSAWPSWRGR
jgi:hypothetical protein